MRFAITSADGRTVLDMIEAPTAEDAIEVFKEDNDAVGRFFCIALTDDPFTEFIVS